MQIADASIDSNEDDLLEGQVINVETSAAGKANIFGFINILPLQAELTSSDELDSPRFREPQAGQQGGHIQLLLVPEESQLEADFPRILNRLYEQDSLEVEASFYDYIHDDFFSGESAEGQLPITKFGPRDMPSASRQLLKKK